VKTARTHYTQKKEAAVKKQKNVLLQTSSMVIRTQ